jgi:hypothetical protein
MNLRILALVGIALVSCKGGNQQNQTQGSTSAQGKMIGPGNWTIANPVRYAFPMRAVGPYRLIPELTLGSNGAMLVAQVEPRDSSVAVPGGNDMAAVVLSGSGPLRVLEAPTGELLRMLDVPLAQWYLAPLATGDSVRSLTVRVRGDSASWQFPEGRRVTP